MRDPGVWFEFHTSLPRHPKTDRLMDVAGIGRATVVGHVAMAIAWAVDFTEDGIIEPARLPALARAADWAGDPASFASAMTEAGWLDPHSAGWRMHDWDEYVGRLMEQRRKAREKKARQRSGEKPEGVDRPDVNRGSHVGDDLSPGRPGPVAGTSLDNRNRNRNRNMDPPMPPGGGEVFSIASRAYALPDGDRREPDDPGKPPSYTAAFLAFWEAYPSSERKKAKAKAFEVWKRHRLTEAHVERLMAALSEDKAGDSWKRDAGAYIPAPAAWLNKKRWHDDPISLARVVPERSEQDRAAQYDWAIRR